MQRRRYAGDRKRSAAARIVSEHVDIVEGRILVRRDGAVIAGNRRSNRIDRHQDGVGRGLGVAAIGLGRGRRHRQREVGIAVGGRREGETDEIGRGQRVAAVAIVRARLSVAPARPEMLIDRVSDPSVSVSADGEAQRDRRVLVAGGIGRGQARRIGHRIDRHLHGVGGGLGIAASGLGRGRRHRQREVGVAVGGRRDGEADEIGRGQRVAAVAVEGARLSVAPARPEMLIDRVSDPSVSVSAEEKLSAIAVSSLPEASGRSGSAHRPPH